MENTFLHKFISQTIDNVLDEYVAGDTMEMAQIPERINEKLLQSQYNNDTTTVYGRFFWLDDKDSDVDCAMGEVIDFCLAHDVVAYSINYDSFDDGFVYVAFVYKRYSGTQSKGK